MTGRPRNVFARAPWLSSALCIMLASLSVLMLQVALTRILSVVLWYHWAFLSISLAMLGVGAPGVWMALRPPGPKLGERLLIAAAVLVPLSVVAIVRYSHLLGDYRALFCAAAILPPMLALGAVICLLLIEADGPNIARIYGFDLLGACLGAVLIIPAMHVVPTPHLAAGLGLVALAAAMVRRGRPSVAAAIAAALVLGLLAWGEPLRVGVTKAYDENNMRVIYARWTPTARLAFFEGVFWRPDQQQAFGWGMGTRAPQVRVEQLYMEQDSSAGTPIMPYGGDPKELEVLLFDVTSLGYQLTRPKRVVVIGAGGGRDILSALAAGAESVDAVEINGAIVETISTRFKELSGDVYHLQGVRPVISEGRSFLRRAEDRYDLIQISLIDSWAATAAGAFSLSENNLYTLEAYRLYLDRLSPGGMIATSRWIRGEMGFELPRLMTLAKRALRDEGVEKPNDHLVLAEAGIVGSLLISKSPLSDDQRRRLQDVAELRGFRVHHPVQVVPLPREEDPGGRFRHQLLGRGAEPEPAAPDPQRSLARPPPKLVRWVLEDERAAAARTRLDLSPPTDDRPFFFHVLPVFEPVDQRLAASYSTNGTAIYVLQLLMMALAVVTVLLFFLPFALGRWLERSKEFWRGSGYFACIGVGFMLVEIPWLQRFILLLEHPSHATTVVLACLLLGAGLGSMSSTRIGLPRLCRYGFAVAAGLGLLNVALPTVFDWLMPLSFATRAVAAGLLLVPIGFALGLFFPLGMRRFGDRNKAWFWAVNGAFSVLASVLSLGLAMQLGFSAVTWIGTAAYVLAWALVRRSGRPAPAAAARQ
ncbi:MAG: hypothetical protein JRI23_18985 [Deltaproteobacteria bacterium]|jgi:hypothetical protein|nr:hypothetical protein [Deltaproteobacteria bacterium]MBW2533950.1 hypothetical protein [Deltaproteobacteria bacterium]